MNEYASVRQAHKTTYPFRVEHTHPMADEEFANQLAFACRSFAPYHDIVCVCVGTDRSTGDALGPLVGSALRKDPPPGLLIYGTLDDPVHALNLEETLENISSAHPHSLVIAVDACLGHFKSVGSIQLGLGPLKPGAGVNKSLPEVGNIHITGIVNVSGFMEYFVLQNTRLSLVMNMAEIISTSIKKACLKMPTLSA
ncbi:spore protease YyaC [Laceyella sacchari]|jgi:putative sporulation protein YyaC|uniref:Sporulation protein YyaC n=1 Tax=Laceyella tengchongensis TaxID=574699 RepID=A0AA45WQL5_9BACL|nr:spore protease YyaC [Laceyella tengchongensis]AUS10292.1 spore protease YyaC [Laceyella sacchari]SMP25719.1 putative sporulation protein YyaC [Laceyella tengchongensis]